MTTSTTQPSEAAVERGAPISVDFALSEEQELLRKSARDLLAAECPATHVREMKADAKGYSPALWAKLADLGILGLTIPTQYDGQGGTFLDLTVVLEEMGRKLMPGPFIPTVILGAETIALAGSEELKQAWLPKVAAGKAILTMAVTEPDGGEEPGSIETRAKPDGDGFVISGTKAFVPDAQAADALVCVARTSTGTGPEGISLFLVDAASPGLTVEPLITNSGEKRAVVTFKDVRVPGKSLIGTLDGGWPVVQAVLDRAAVAQSAMMLGGMHAVLEMTVGYATQRIAFGVPIGSFQAIQHRHADNFRDVTASRLLTYEAAWRLAAGLPTTKEAAMAKGFANLAFRRIVTDAHQTHAGVGIYDGYDLGLYTQRAKVGEFTYGTTAALYQRVAAELGL